MGIWDKLKGEFIDIVEYLDESGNTLVHRFDRYNNEIKNGAELIVRESQHAVFVREGTIADVFAPGHYQLDTGSMPVLSTLLGWKHGFESPFKAEVYFVNTKMFTGNKWGTQNPVPLRDADFGVVRIRAFGAYNFKITDPRKFVAEISGTGGRFQIEGIGDQMRTLVVSQFTDALGELKIPALDLAARYNELGDSIEEILNKEMEHLGLSISQFTIENISMPPEVEAALDKRSSMAALGNMDQYMKFQSANAMEEAARNPGSGMGDMMGAGMGMAMGMGMAGQFGQPAQTSGQGAPAGGPPPVPPQVQYFLAVNGQQQGPYTIVQMQQMVNQGQLTRETQVWRQGMEGWMAAGTVPDFQSLFGAVPPPPPPA